jgi:hypothetical protein
VVAIKYKKENFVNVKIALRDVFVINAKICIGIYKLIILLDVRTVFVTEMVLLVE